MRTRLRSAAAGFFFLLLLTPAGPPAFGEDLRPVVVITTSKGVIEVELDGDKAPKTVANFLSYTDAGFYEGTVIHRVVPGFMIQGGGLTPDLKKKDVQPPVVNEAKNGLRNARGTIAMARTNHPDSATSQFFINLVDNRQLDYRGLRSYGYAVFGRVVEGMDVVDEIASVETVEKGVHKHVPVETIFIESVKRKGLGEESAPEESEESAP